MGFLKFLTEKEKIKKDSSKNSLDLPPLLPIDETTHLELKDPFEELPPLPDIDEDSDESEGDIDEKSDMAFELPPLPDIDEDTDITYDDEQPKELQFPDINQIPDFLEDDEESNQTVKEINQELESLHNKKDLEGPLFVNIVGFKELLEDIDIIKKDLRNGSKILENIIEFKNTQDHKFMKWENSLEEVEKKLMYIDKSLFETKHY
jgi:hypothetical protein